MKVFRNPVLANLLVVSDYDICSLRLFHGHVDGVAHFDVEVIHGAEAASRLGMLSSMNEKRSKNVAVRSAANSRQECTAEELGIKVLLLESGRVVAWSQCCGVVVGQEL